MSNENIYLMNDKMLYKIVNKLKYGVEVVEVPILYEDKSKINKNFSRAEIIYNTDFDDKALIKIKFNNVKLREFHFYEKFNENKIKYNKFIFDVIEFKHDINYNCRNMIRI